MWCLGYDKSKLKCWLKQCQPHHIIECSLSARFLCGSDVTVEHLLCRPERVQIDFYTKIKQIFS